MNPLHRLREIDTQISTLTAERNEIEALIARAVAALGDLPARAPAQPPALPTQTTNPEPSAIPERADEGLNLTHWARAQRNATEKQMRVELRNFFLANPNRWFAVCNLARLIQRGEGDLRKRVAHLTKVGFLQTDHLPKHDAKTARTVPVYCLHPRYIGAPQALVKTTNSSRKATPEKSDKRVSEGTYEMVSAHILAQLPERGITGKTPMELIIGPDDQSVCARSTLTIILNRMVRENLLKTLGNKHKKYLRA